MSIVVNDGAFGEFFGAKPDAITIGISVISVSFSSDQFSIGKGDTKNVFEKLLI